MEPVTGYLRDLFRETGRSSRASTLTTVRCTPSAAPPQPKDDLKDIGPRLERDH
jgi:hypothetical protein